MDKKKIIAIVLAAVMVISIIAFAVTKSMNGSENPETAEPVAYSYDTSEYTAATVQAADGKILMPSYVENIYYTADLDGDIAFYEYAGGTFTASSAEVKTLSVKLSASTESIPMKIKYIVVNGQTVGYGLFTSDMDSSVDLYDFVFTELRNMPASYGKSYLLLSDYDKEDFRKTDKTYNEIYEYDLKSTSVSVKLSQNTRLIDHSGTYRQDWEMLSDEFIANMGSGKYFMSSRYYSEEETGERTDVMTYSNAYRPAIVVEDMLGYWFVNDDDGLHYMVKTDDGFKAVVKNDKKTKDTAELKGDLFTDYLRSGNYVINKTTREMTNLLTGKSTTIGNIDISKATAFSLSADGTKAAFGVPGEENSNGALIQKVIYCAVDGSIDPVTYTEPQLWCEEGSFVWLDASHCMSIRPVSTDGTETASIIYTF